VSHGSARLTVHGRRLIVQRHQAGWKQAHIAAAMGISRKCVKTWIERYAAEGEAGLLTRSSRPHSMPTKTTDEVEHKVLAARAEHRRGQDWLGAELGVAPRTVARILRRHQVAYLRELDPMTGEVIRASKTTATRYERDRPGELVHMDVKKIGRIPDGGGWKAHGRGKGNRDRKSGVGYDYIHSLVDDHSRFAYSEILPDEKGPTCAAFLLRAAAAFILAGIPRIERVITDNHLSYKPLGRHAGGHHGAGSAARVHQAALPVAKRQGRAVQPDPRRGVGLPPALHHQRRPCRRPCTMAGALQH
jgi:DNA-binding XRE family transcriptional regulator